jgi:hypothetical protein
MRFSSTGAGTDDEIQRIAREDHAINQPTDHWTNDMGGFGEPAFAEYQTPPRIASLEEIAPVMPTKKKRRIVIIEDESHTVPDAEFRLWPQRYREMQAIAKERKRNLYLGRIAKENAARLLWGWDERTEKELPPALKQMFSRDALIRRWKPENDVVSPEKRKRVEEDVEFGLGVDGGFGDADAFQPMDYSVSHLGIWLT